MDPGRTEQVRTEVDLEGAGSYLKRQVRNLLLLGRVSNLPTVWSNCLAGWLLGSGGTWMHFGFLTLGVTFLYLGGMYLNDAFDAVFDRQRRPERPIPSGTIRRSSVWQWGFSWLALGCISLVFLEELPMLLGLALAAGIVVYNAIHKIFALSPILMGCCRMLVVLLAAAAATAGITGQAAWSALVLGSYTAGLTWLARRESTFQPVPAWPCVFLAPPLVLAFIINVGEYRVRGWVLMAVLMLWLLRSLRFAYWVSQPRVGRAVSGLLAGIILVDLLAVGPVHSAVPFLALFGLAMLLQRFVPAT